MASGELLKVFVDLAPLAPDGSNGGAAVIVLRLLRALLARPDAHEYHLLVKPAAESAVSDLIGAGAILHRLGPGLDVEEPRRLAAGGPRAHPMRRWIVLTEKAGYSLRQG